MERLLQIPLNTGYYDYNRFNQIAKDLSIENVPRKLFHKKGDFGDYGQ